MKSLQELITAFRGKVTLAEQAQRGLIVNEQIARDRAAIPRPGNLVAPQIVGIFDFLDTASPEELREIADRIDAAGLAGCGL